jgi:hypothetical protein
MESSAELETEPAAVLRYSSPSFGQSRIISTAAWNSPHGGLEMLDLSKDMTHADAINHLRATFPLHLTHDVEPSAPFAALRSVFAGIDC